MKEKFWNIPNALSLYRIVAFPIIIFLILTGKEQIVGVLIAVNLFTDWLDGIIARTFNMQTRIGARLDSWADMGTYICAFLAIGFFKWEFFKPHAWILYVFFILWMISYAQVFIKFKGLIGLHTYLFKTTGYAQGIFIILLFMYQFIPWLFYLSIAIGIIALLEEMIIIYIIDRPMMNVKGLYWILKDRKK